MSSKDIDLLEPELMRLLDAERARPGMPSDMRDELLRRLELGLALGPGGGTPSGDGPAPSGGNPAPAAPLPTPTLGAAVQGVSAVLVATALVAGAIAGGSLVAVLGPRVPAPVAVAMASVDARVSVAAQRVLSAAPPPAAAASPDATGNIRVLPMAAVPTVAASATAAPPIVGQPASTPVASAAASARTGRDGDLAAERALLEVARTAVGRGQGAAALEALAQHAREFPRGRLTEEREALQVQSLIAAGRREEAKRRAASFRASFPNSLLLPVLEASLGPIP